MATYYVDHAGGSDGAAGTSTGTAWQTIRKAMATVAAGDTVYVKGGQDYTEQQAPATGAVGYCITNGTPDAPISFIGYTSTITDGGRATLNAGTSSLGNAISGPSFSNYVFKNFVMTGATVSNLYNCSYSWVHNCVFTNAIQGAGECGSCLFTSCDFKNNTSYGIGETEPNNTYVNCRFLDNGLYSVSGIPYYAHFFNCIFARGVGGEFYVNDWNGQGQGVCTLVNCTMYGYSTSVNAIFGANTCNVQIINSIITHYAGVIDWDAPPSAYQSLLVNCILNATDSNPLYTTKLNCTTADPLLTNPGSDDFTLQAGSPAIDAGLGYRMDVGGMQFAASAGGILIPSRMCGGFQ